VFAFGALATWTVAPDEVTEPTTEEPGGATSGTDPDEVSSVASDGAKGGCGCGHGGTASYPAAILLGWLVGARLGRYGA